MKGWLRRAAWLAALALGLLWGWGLAQAVRAPIERRATLTLAGLPKGAPPYRVALLSDIHFGNRAMQPERLAAIVDTVNAERPDLILLAGDFVNGTERLESDPAQLSAGLARLKARDGVIAVPGNHDHWPDLPAVRGALARAGIPLLANQALRAGPLLVLGGLALLGAWSLRRLHLRREQAGRTVSGVVVGAALGLPGPQRQERLRAVEAAHEVAPRSGRALEGHVLVVLLGALCAVAARELFR